MQFNRILRLNSVKNVSLQNTMKQFFHKIVSVLMAFVVLTSTMSFTVHQHFCGGELVDSAVFSKAESCGMEMEPVTDKNECTIEREDCCSDKVKYIEGQQELKTQTTQLNFSQEVFLISFVYASQEVFEEVSIENVLYRNFKPPLIVEDIQVLDCVFII